VACSVASLIQRKSYAEIGNLLYMSVKSVQRYIGLFSTTGTVAPTAYKHGPDQVLSEFEQWILIQSIIHTPTIFLHEMQHKLYTTTGKNVHVSTICRTLKHLGITRQKSKSVVSYSSAMAFRSSCLDSFF